MNCAYHVVCLPHGLVFTLLSRDCGMSFSLSEPPASSFACASSARTPFCKHLYLVTLPDFVIRDLPYTVNNHLFGSTQYYLPVCAFIPSIRAETVMLLTAFGRCLGQIWAGTSTILWFVVVVLSSSRLIAVECLKLDFDASSLIVLNSLFTTHPIIWCCCQRH